jgi:ATP-dependent helicase/nuclease subunit A
MGADASATRKATRPMKRLPHDQAARDRFATELGRNFSVTAAAGTGKTTAITKRIVEIARAPNAKELLPRLVVVTFTNRAADEMQQRAREEIFRAYSGADSDHEPAKSTRLSLEVLTTFNRAFFGTIHSFCTKLLATYGHHLGLPSRLDLISDDEELWNDFVQHTVSVGEGLSPQNRARLVRHVQLRDLMELGRSGRLPLALEERDLNCPDTIQIQNVISYPGGGVRIDVDKEALSKWKEQFESDSDFVPLVQRTSDSANFSERWEDAFHDFNDWLSCCALKVAAEVQAKYRQFRVQRGAVTFDDQIALALQLTQNTEAISRIRAKDYIVILDEAQDTDPQQFLVLTEITRPVNAAGRWIDNLQEPPRPGRFCMVGDFQQSIYTERANLKQYRRVHDAFVNSDAGEELKFSVTFRLDQEEIDFVNQCFRDILNDVGRVGFIELNPRPDKLPGQVVRLDITPEILKHKPDASDPEKAQAEAAQLAKWLAQTGCEKLRARSWGQVAILCPRKKWFAPIADALRREAIDSQIQSETDVKGDSPAHAWFTALLTIMTQPRCGFEIVGVLREVFGLSDHDLAIFSDGYGDRFQIEKESGGPDVVGQTLDLLTRIHSQIADKPLFNAVEQIVEETQLPARLQKLPLEDFEDIDHELDVLLQSAASAEAEGQTLEEFSELLRANFTTERESGVPRSDAIQLITCQKAKGLEWDAVIVPFLSRRIHTGEENFPRILVDRETQRAIVVFSKSDIPAAAKGAVEKTHEQEMERLLYVALTRARHTLVVATDRELFAKAHGDAPSNSLTKWFRSDRGEPNEPRIADKEAKPAACGKTRAHQLRLMDSEQKSQEIADFPRPALATAKLRAEEFFRRLNPSGFIAGDGEIGRTGPDAWKEAESEFRARSLPGPATRYGVWWHEFAQKIPWNMDANLWHKVFQESLAVSPDPSRAKREWKLLREQISKLSDFPLRSATRTSVFRPEMPFFWRMDDNQCLEGIVDVALFEPSERKWFIVDWKTNRIERDEIDKLRVYYRPQIAAYWKAVAELTQQPVDAGIYSTAIGEFILYDRDELYHEWARLKSLATDQFAAEIGRRGSDEIRESSGQLEFGEW